MPARVQTLNAPPLAGDSRTQWEILREAAHSALWTVATIVRNASLCSCIAWLAILCFSQGNVFSSKPVGDQSYTSFMGAEVVMTHSFTSSMIVVTLAQVLRAQYLAGNSNRAPSLWFCILKLVKRTFAQQVATLVLMAFATYLIGLTSSALRPLKLEFYLACMASHPFLCHADLTTRGIIREETAMRRRTVQSVDKNHDRGVSSVQASNFSTDQQPPVQHPRRRSPWSRYWHHFFSTLPVTMFVFLAGLYVHSVKSLRIGNSQLDVALFTCGSTLFKLIVQEFAKWGALRKHIRDIRVMCVIVGVPTVLIDTQIRLVVQRLQDTQGTIAGTVLMAVIEIAMRASKLWFAKLEVNHRERAVTATSIEASATAAMTDTARWKRNILKLYVAEVYADMAAEYIAIGCSTSILFFYRSHPKYLLGGAIAESPSAVNQLTVLGSQVGIEIAVDSLTSTLEVYRGMDFRELRKHGAFILAFFVLLTLINIQVFTAIYLLT